MRPRLYSVLVLILIAAFVLGCGATPTATPPPAKAPAAAPTTAPAAATKPPTSAPAPATGKSINVLLIADKEFVPALAKEYEQQTSVKVNIELAAYEDMLTKLAASAVAKKGSYDVISGDIVAWRAAGYMEPIEGRINALPDVAELQAKEMGKMGDHLYSMPWLVDNRIFTYNSKILKDAGYDKPPATTDEFIKMAQDIQSKGLSKYPIMFPWKQHEGEFTDYHAWICTFGGRLFDDQYTKPMFNSPEGVAALQFLVDLNLKYKLINPDSMASKSAQVSDVMAQGQTAFGTTWSILSAPLNDPKTSKAAGLIRVGIFPTPAGKTSCSRDGSESLAIAADSKNKDEAWSFIKFLTSKPTEKKVFLDQSILPVWKSLFSDPEVVKANPLLPDIVAQRAKVDYQPSQTWYDDFSSILQVAILKAVTGEAPAQKALDDAATDVAKLIKK